MTPQSTTGGSGSSADSDPGFFDYTVFYADRHAASVRAPDRRAALAEARAFHPQSPAERVFDGWRTYDAVTDEIIGQVSGRPGKGTIGDPGPFGTRPIVPRRAGEARWPPVLLINFRAQYADGFSHELYAPDPSTALRKARSFYLSPVLHLHDGTRLITAEMIEREN